MLPDFLRFESIIYPLWRLHMPRWAKPAMTALYRRFYPIDVDLEGMNDADTMADFLLQWNLVQGADKQSLIHAMQATPIPIETIDMNGKPQVYKGAPLHVPAQWQPTERTLISWGRMYPNLWEMHAQMVEAITPVAIAEVLVPSEAWARGVAVYLQARGKANLENIRLSVLPTNDIWIRDYGAIMGIAPDGQRVAVNPTYAVLPQYPQADDNGMTERWAAHHGVAVRPLDLHTEGGNLWSDGAGTFIMSSQIFYSNRYYNRTTMLDFLHSVFDFEKAIIAPRLTLEETGHIDLLAKLASADTVLVSQASSPTTEEALRKVKRLFERETNAQGQPYRVLELPTPPLYLNWISYTIRRAYTNSYTINGRVLVPVFGIPQDEIALKVYQQALPDYDIIPIDSVVGINGGGAVHCMTKEIPMG